jgi:hypothetical protein
MLGPATHCTPLRSRAGLHPAAPYSIGPTAGSARRDRSTGGGGPRGGCFADWNGWRGFRDLSGADIAPGQGLFIPAKACVVTLLLVERRGNLGGDHRPDIASPSVARPVYSIVERTARDHARLQRSARLQVRHRATGDSHRQEPWSVDRICARGARHGGSPHRHTDHPSPERRHTVGMSRASRSLLSSGMG